MFDICCQIHIALLKGFFNRMESTIFSHLTNTRKPLTIWWDFIIFIHFYLLLVWSFFHLFIHPLYVFFCGCPIHILCLFFCFSIEILIFFILMICKCSLYKGINMLLYLLQIFSSCITWHFIFYVVFLPYNV